MLRRLLIIVGLALCVCGLCLLAYTVWPLPPSRQSLPVPPTLWLIPR